MDDHQIPQISTVAKSEVEEISDSFLCCVCLDLLYKPIVLSCGHISCFWCVHRSMRGVDRSYCPLCRHPYIHFPTICQLLHFLLLKMYPVAYKRRELQILEEEKELDYFSPQFDACSSQANQESNALANSGCGESCANVKEIESFSHIEPKQSCDGDFEGIGIDREQNSVLSWDGRSCNQISVADVLCAACKQLLFHPVVLNCGHVYCESCIINSDEQSVRCKVCESRHPSGLPKACLELGHFLEAQFPKEYALRRDAVQLKEADCKHENRNACAIKGDAQEQTLSLWSDPSLQVHSSAGCDSCGMFPIIGDRYKCLDCVETAGFDLCSDCFDSRSNRPGRFNQKHTADHMFERIHKDPIVSEFKLLSGSLAFIIGDFTTQASSSQGLFSLRSSTDARENTEDTSSASSSPPPLLFPSRDEQDDSPRTI